MSAEKCFTSGPATAPLIMPDLMVNSDSKLHYKMKNHSSLNSSPVHVVLLKNGRATFSNSNYWPGFDPYISIHQPTSICNNSDIRTAQLDQILVYTAKSLQDRSKLWITSLPKGTIPNATRPLFNDFMKGYNL